MRFLEPEGKAQKSHSIWQIPATGANPSIQISVKWESTNVRTNDIGGTTALCYLVHTMDVCEYIVEIIWRMDEGEST